MHPVAVEAVARVEADAWGNPASLHRVGVRAARALTEAGERAAVALRVPPGRVVWVSGSTEAAHAAAHAAAGWCRGGRALLGGGEHPAVRGALEAAFGRERVVTMGLDRHGRVDPGQAGDLISGGGVGLVAIQAASPESGVLQPWREVAALARSRGVPVVVDATSWIGRMDSEGLAEADFVFCGGHKLGAPRGVGVLLVPEDRSVHWLAGGGQQGGRRGGTENVAGAVAMAAVLGHWEGIRPVWAKAQEAARDRFESVLAAAWPEFRVLGAGVARLPQTAFALMPWGEQERWVLQLDRLGFAVGTGTACATGRGGSSPIAAAAGLEPEEARRLVRFTGGWGTPSEAWDELAQAVLAVGSRLRE